MRSLILSYKPSIIHSWLFYSNLVNYILRILSTNYLMIVSKRGSNFWYTKKHFYVNKLIYSKSDYVITNSQSLKNYTKIFYKLNPLCRYFLIDYIGIKK